MNETFWMLWVKYLDLYLIDLIGRDSFFYIFDIELYYNYQIYLDSAA